MSKQLAEVFIRAAKAHSDSPPDLAAATESPQHLSLPDLLCLHGEASAAVLPLLMALLSVMPMAGVGTLLSFVIFVIAWR